jgi:hypothetical protein
MQKTQPPYCSKGVFIAPLHSNGSYSIIACIFVAARICLPSCCLEKNVCYYFIIPALGRHVTLTNNLVFQEVCFYNCVQIFY